MDRSVLVVAAHPDDEVLGCGGTMKKYVDQGCKVHVLILGEGATARGQEREVNEHASELLQLRQCAFEANKNIIGVETVDFAQLPDQRFDDKNLLDIVKIVERYVDRHQPSTVYTHHSSDVNFDHRITHDAVITACRSTPSNPVKELLFFEIPSSTEWRPGGTVNAFHPNWFVDISRVIDVKMKALKAYEVEMRDFPHPRSYDAIRALHTWRGATIGVVGAESFVLGRKIWT